MAIMTQQIQLDHVLDSAEALSFDEKEALLEILQKRILESRRAHLAKDIHEADEEFAKGKCSVVDAATLFKEIS